MRLQAILLFLIILVSLLINDGIDSGEKSVFVAEKAEKKSLVVFVEDFRSAISEKSSAAGDALIENFNQNANTINQNFGLLKEILFLNINGVFSKLNSKRSFSNVVSSDSKNFKSEQSIALISEGKMNYSVPLCNFDQVAISSKVILIKYLDYPSNIFAMNPEKRWPIASLTKLMTSLIAIEKIDLNREVVISEKAINSDGVSGNFKADEVFKAGDLVKAMLVASSNDAAMAISEILGEKNFIDEMQRKATELQMFQTTYLEPTGLSFINQSTANDMVKLITYINKKHPEVFEISRQKEIEILELKSIKSRKILTINKFAGQPDFIGGKTGYIEEAGRNLIALFNINGKTVLTITFGADDSFSETEKLKGFVQNCKTK